MASLTPLTHQYQQLQYNIERSLWNHFRAKDPSILNEVLAGGANLAEAGFCFSSYFLDRDDHIGPPLDLAQHYQALHPEETFWKDIVEKLSEGLVKVEETDLMDLEITGSMQIRKKC